LQHAFLVSGRVLRLLAFLRDLAGGALALRCKGPPPEWIAREYVRRLTTGGGDDRSTVALRIGTPPRSLLRRLELVRERRRWRVRAPSGGRLTVDAHPWGAVYLDGAPVRGGRGSGIVLDGKRVAITPVVDLALEAGWHQVRVDHIHLADGSVRMRAVRDVEVPAGGSAALVMRLEPVPA
jgi:hypothetical protein